MDPTVTYRKLKSRKIRYYEEIHCIMMLEIYPHAGRVSAFCAEACIGETMLWKWLNTYPLFKECYELAKVFAREYWEQEYIDNKDDETWDKKYWMQRGSRYSAKESGTKIVLDVDENSNPWEQYAQIIKQAKNGNFSASEIKQLMESVNIGTRVHESFKLQQEVDKMKDDLMLMANRNGNNIVSIAKAT